MLLIKIFSCLSIPAEELGGCNDPELPMKVHVKQWVAFYDNLDRKVSVIGYTIYMHLVYDRKGSPLIVINLSLDM